MKSKGMVVGMEENGDFKYLLQDMGHVYLGARYRYEEMLEEERVPFKLKAVISHYLLKDVEASTSLESHFYYMTEGDFAFSVYEQLKARVKVVEPEKRKRLFGGESVEYVERMLAVRELARMNLARKKAAGLMVREIIISRTALGAFSV